MSLEARFPTVGKDLHSLKAIARERNVVHIVLESTGAQYLTMYGARENPMPFLEKIAARGLVFENAYTTYPESIKGLFATLTGFYPALDTAPKDYERLQPPSLPSELARNGYRTALFHSARFAYLGMNSIIRNRGFQTLQDAGDISGEKQSTFGISDERQTVERMLDWIDESSREQNFYLAYLPAAGHHPYGSPDEPAFSIEDPYGQYLNALRHTDTSLEILINGLKSRGLYDNTLFVIHGDHGEAFGQKPENFVHSLFIYEENVHVPFIIFGEGLSLQGRSEKVSSLVNIPATVLDLVGLYTKNIFQGTSLISEIEQTSFFFTDYSQSLLGLRDGKWKFVLELDTKIAKLFDLSIDERETKNIAESHPQLTEDFRQRILQWAYRQQHELGTLKECTVKEFADCRTNSVTLHPSHARM